MKNWVGFWIALAFLFLAIFVPNPPKTSNCDGTRDGTDSIAMAIVKYLEK